MRFLVEFSLEFLAGAASAVPYWHPVCAMKP